MFYHRLKSGTVILQFVVFMTHYICITDVSRHKGKPRLPCFGESQLLAD